ncbi:MAG: hypothetical protein Q7S06_03465 [Nanoarchaeota archaeon]|nr:hypothetical protein [Nanoarchaeota archaeon]
MNLADTCVECGSIRKIGSSTWFNKKSPYYSLIFERCKENIEYTYCGKCIEVNPELLYPSHQQS